LQKSDCEISWKVSYLKSPNNIVITKPLDNNHYTINGFDGPQNKFISE
jgi:hypothetical protein